MISSWAPYLNYVCKDPYSKWGYLLKVQVDIFCCIQPTAGMVLSAQPTAQVRVRKTCAKAHASCESSSAMLYLCLLQLGGLCKFLFLWKKASHCSCNPFLLSSDPKLSCWVHFLLYSLRYLVQPKEMTCILNHYVFSSSWLFPCILPPYYELSFLSYLSFKPGLIPHFWPTILPLSWNFSRSVLELSHTDQSWMLIVKYSVIHRQLKISHAGSIYIMEMGSLYKWKPLPPALSPSSLLLFFLLCLSPFFSPSTPLNFPSSAPPYHFVFISILAD